MHPVGSDYVKHVYSEEQKYWYNFACFIKFCIFFFFFFLESGDSCISCAVSVILHFMFIIYCYCTATRNDNEKITKYFSFKNYVLEIYAGFYTKI